ncbi:MAG: HesA/MoeB/ThiF family protein [Rhodobacteraceae bacterium]|nr:HesA/MoeB/ThiF family protein [Paracoccaceae bacterium]
MVWFLLLAAGLWALGARMRAPVQARWQMIGLLYVAVLAALVALPAGSPLRVSLGGTLAEWLVLGGLAAAVWAYGQVLARIRARATAKEAASAPKPPPITSGEAERYARHILLREIGGPGQAALKRARVLVIGAGGLGSPVLQYLAAAGVGTIGVIDDDAVEVTNLQRQVIHADARLGMPKVFSAEAAMVAQNPYVTVRPYNRRLTPDIAADLFADYDLILDGSDNFDTRYLANEVAARLGKPLIAAAITQWEGQLALWHPAGGGPCYACVFPDRPAPGLVPTCAEAGVAGPLPGVMGTLMALEAVKHICAVGEPFRGRMLLFDGLWGETRTIRTAPRPGCSVCGGVHAGPNAGM